MAVTNFTDATPSMPTLNGVNGSGVAVLDFALGAMGYTTIASSGNQRIYQPPGGTTYCLYVAHDSAISGDARSMTVRIVEPTSTIGALVNPAPNTTQQTDSSFKWNTSQNATVTAVPFDLCVSNGLGQTPPFISFISNSTAATSVGGYWGVGYPMGTLTDPYCCIIMAFNGAGIPGATGVVTCVGTLTQIPGSNVGRAYWARNRDGSTISTNGCLGYPGSAGGGGWGTWTGGAAYPHPDTGGLHHRYPIMLDNASTTTTVAGKAILERAALPGLRMPLHGAVGSVGKRDTFSDTAHHASASFSLYTFSTTGWYAVETTDTFIAPTTT